MTEDEDEDEDEDEEEEELYKKPYSSLVCEFGGFENVLRDVDILYNVYRRYDVGLARGPSPFL